jgi:hypothetical protein
VTQVITGTPKDAIDELIERAKAIEKMLEIKPASTAREDAILAMHEADAWLTRARAAAARMASGRVAV